MLSLDQLIEKARAMRASDVHIVCGLPAKCRVDGNVTDLTGEVLTAADCEMLARELAGAEYETMADIGELDMARSFPDGGRTRVNLFRQQGSVSAAIPSAGRPYPLAGRAVPAACGGGFRLLPQRHRAGHGRDGLR